MSGRWHWTPLRGSIFRRVLLVVIGAGLVALTLSTFAIVHIVGDDREASLVEGALRHGEASRAALDHAVALGRAEIRTAALAVASGRLDEVPGLLSDNVLAVRFGRGEEELLYAARDDAARRRMRAEAAHEPGTVTLVDAHTLALAEEVGGVRAQAWVDVRAALPVPQGWTLQLVAADATPTSRTPGMVARRGHADADDALVHVQAPSHHGVTVDLSVPLGPAKERALAMTRTIVLWSSLAGVPLILLAWLLARMVTGPIRTLARAVQTAGEGPVRLPELRRDEIGELGQAIRYTSERLHADTEALRAAVRFSRRVWVHQEPQQVLHALERALSRALPAQRWHVVSRYQLEHGEVPEPVALDAAVLQIQLEQQAREATTITRDSLPTDDPSSSLSDVRARTSPCGRRVFVALRTPSDGYGVVVGSGGGHDELVVRHAELLCRIAVAALRNLELFQSVAVNEKLVALGRLAAGVAHEMNNPLAFVLANLRILEDELEGEQGEAARDAKEGAERLARIVRDLSSLSKGGAAFELKSCDLLALVRQTSRIAQARRPGMRIDVSGPPNLRVGCDRGRIEQILLNLMINAADAAGPEVTPHVQVHLGVDGSTAVVTLADNGAGVPAAIMGRLFQPFETTKGSDGTGLGLFLSRSFAQAHGGDLVLASTGPLGSTFKLTLPGSVMRPGASDPPLSLQPTPVRRPSILVVDDEPAIVRAMQRWLGRYADVTAVTDPNEALGLACERRFSLVLCDVNMPGMDGFAFADALRTRSPDAASRLVFMTGGTDESPDGVPILRKPIEPEEVRGLLGIGAAPVRPSEAPSLAS
jgi:CheY-like chemotaxis protein